MMKTKDLHCSFSGPNIDGENIARDSSASENNDCHINHKTTKGLIMSGQKSRDYYKSLLIFKKSTGMEIAGKSTNC